MKGKLKKSLVMLMVMVMIFSMGVTTYGGVNDLPSYSEEVESQDSFAVQNQQEEAIDDQENSHIIELEQDGDIEEDNEKEEGLEDDGSEEDVKDEEESAVEDNGYTLKVDNQTTPCCINSYTVTFDSMGGSPVLEMTVVVGSKVTRPTDPIKAEFVFGGWYKDLELETKWNFNEDVMPAEDIVLYAQWDYEIPKVIDVVVPAIWYPVDKDTNEVIEGLNPIPTYPDMYSLSEVAKLVDGVYMIDYMGVPKPSPPGSWSANNFMYTNSLWFTDRFHRIVARGYGTFELDVNSWQPGSAVRKLEYGNFIDEALFDEEQGMYKGLLGIEQAVYQEGETMSLYVVAKIEDNILSKSELKTGLLEVGLDKSDEEIRQILIGNIEKVEHLDIDLIEEWVVKEIEFDIDDIKELYVYKYNSEDNTKGSFILEEDESIMNFWPGGLSSLPEGKYEVVFPIYWQRPTPDSLNGSYKFSRNRYKFDDTFHFTLELKSVKYSVIFVDYDGTILKTETVEHGNDATAPSSPSRPGYTFIGWDKEFIKVTSNLTVTAQYRSNGGGSTTPSKPKDDSDRPSRPKTPEIVVVPKEEIPADLPLLNKGDHFQYIQGYIDGTVRPEGNITRDEVAAVFYRLLDMKYRKSIKTADHKFTDVATNRWSNTHIATLANGGIITGYYDGTFKPSRYITRAEMATIASKFDNLSPFEKDSFSDIKGHWANKYINSAVQKGWVSGYKDGTFKPDQNITRAEFVTLVNNVLERKVKKDDILPGAKQFPDLSKDKWYYEAMQEAINSHHYERQENGYEIWTDIYFPQLEM